MRTLFALLVGVFLARPVAANPEGRPGTLWIEAAAATRWNAYYETFSGSRTTRYGGRYGLDLGWVVSERSTLRLGMLYDRGTLGDDLNRDLYFEARWRLYLIH